MYEVNKVVKNDKEPGGFEDEKRTDGTKWLQLGFDAEKSNRKTNSLRVNFATNGGKSWDKKEEPLNTWNKNMDKDPEKNRRQSVVYRNCHGTTPPSPPANPPTKPTPAQTGDICVESGHRVRTQTEISFRDSPAETERFVGQCVSEEIRWYNFERG